MSACLNNHPKVVEKLLAERANPDLRNEVNSKVSTACLVARQIKAYCHMSNSHECIEVMGKSCNCLPFIKSCVFNYKYCENPYQYRSSHMRTSA